MKAGIEESRRCTALALPTANRDSIFLSASMKDEGMRDNKRRRPTDGFLKISYWRLVCRVADKLKDDGITR
jgi:hypothetical protein